MNEKNLKYREYYEDLYDLITIEECIRLDAFSMKAASKLNDKEKQVWSGAINEIVLYFKKGARYEKREDTIREWMERDRKRDEFINCTNPPHISFKCPDCSSTNVKNIHKDTSHRDESRVLFMFDCLSCESRYAFYDDGERYKSHKEACDKCQEEMESDAVRKDDVITTTYVCKSCGNVKKSSLDLSSKEHDELERKNKELLDKYRSEFCMLDKEGQEYVSSRLASENLSKTLEEWKRKDVDPRYKKVKKLKILKVQQLKKLLQMNIVKDGYVNLEFSKVDVGRLVALPFQIEDSSDDRSEYDSRNELKKLIQAVLKPTNWRLMSDGIHYRLGLLSGRLRAYEREEDLVKIV